MGIAAAHRDQRPLSGLSCKEAELPGVERQVMGGAYVEELKS